MANEDAKLQPRKDIIEKPESKMGTNRPGENVDGVRSELSHISRQGVKKSVVS